jgi:membrane protein involved in colicin uptake
MKTFQEFMSICEASDPDAAKQLGWGGGASITRQGEGGRIGRERKKTTPERRRMKAVGGGKMEPVEYKPRKDIGTQRQASTRVQQPTQERGSADVKAKAAAAAKEERKKAALARIAAKKKGEAAPEAKPKAKEIEKTASKLLSTKKPEEKPAAEKKPKAAPSGLTRAERDKKRNAELRAKYNAEKEKAFAGYKEVHGKPPTGKERTKLIAAVQKAHPPR